MRWHSPLTLEDLNQYCEMYGIPFEHLAAILDDPKVLPMLRGKGLEYFVYDKLQEALPPSRWVVKKLRVNPQPGSTDVDLLVIHRDSNAEVIVETKTPWRGSFRISSPRKPFPYFRVKCHKSRSNTRERERNDRYLVDEFDMIITNCENAVRIGGESFELTDDKRILEFLHRYYGTREQIDLITKLATDLRCVATIQIAQSDGTLPRQPEVRWEGDPHWKKFEGIEALLLEVVKQKRIRAKRRPSRPAHRRSMS